MIKTTRVRPAQKVLRSLTVAALALTLLAAFVPSAAAAQQTLIVGPGGTYSTIQAAVDAARSGDVIKINAGVYEETVCVVGKGLTVQGAGRDSTIIRIPADESKWRLTPCWTPGAPEGSATESVSALKFLNPTKRVVVTDLQTQGPLGADGKPGTSPNRSESGIVAWGANGFIVTKTKGVGHRVYGILGTAESTNITVSNNIETGVADTVGRSGTAGISVGDTPNAAAVIANNQSTGWNLGIFARESRSGKIANNVVGGNCVGILIFDDAATERPTVNKNFQGGDWDVLNNTSTANNRFCLAGRNGDMKVSGVGMTIANADDVLVAGNTITGNAPSLQDVNFPPAGLSILTVPSPTDPQNPYLPGPADNVRVVGNRITNNVPVDIFEFAIPVGPGVPVPQPTTPTVYVGNRCNSSVPPSICGA